MATQTAESVRKRPPSRPSGPPPSPALEWLWQYLSGEAGGHVLDCGPVCRSTMNVLLKRCRKLYCMDLVSSLRRKEGPFWDRTGKTPVFLVEPWLAQLSVVEPATLSVILGWHLLDLVPREAVEPAVERLYSLLQPGGVMFYLLREPYLAAGADATFELDGLKTIVAKGTGSAPFPNPVLPTRELEKFVPAAKLKTFLTRSGRREIVVMK